MCPDNQAVGVEEAFLAGLRPRTTEEVLHQALEQAKQELTKRDPRIVGWQSGAELLANSGEPPHWLLRFLGDEFRISQEGAEVLRVVGEQKASASERLLLLHYLLKADGHPLANRWVAFREFPEGLSYDAAFQARANRRLAEFFGSDAASFSQAAQALGGERLHFGDASFLFRTLPRLWQAVVFYAADEEFGASARILFDGSAHHYLPTEDLAVLGGLLSSRLVRAARG
ncbi:MAG: DUF3786 domain-containing protein [Chloroflexi bacterium]|nr:DUF3786 domain-containing protein [Chloroflexota bacterium]